MCSLRHLSVLAALALFGGATTLVVFGEAVGHLYLEAFDVTTGAVRCRWATNLWDAEKR